MPEPGGTAPAQARPFWDPSPERQRLLAFPLLFLITLPMLTKIFTSDFGTHLAIGRQHVAERALLHREFLNYPSLGIPQEYSEWGFQVVLYLVHAAGGVYAVSFFIWVLVFGIFLFLHRAIVLRGGNPLLAVAAIFAFSGFLRIRIQPRPEIFTYFYIALTTYLLTEYYYGRRKRLLYAFPPLVVVWANSHPSFLMAFILSCAFFADRLARAAYRKELAWGKIREWCVTPVVVGGVGLLLCGLNPHGYDQILAPLHLLSRGGGQSSVLLSISELTPVRGTGFFAYYKAAAVFAAVSLLLGLLGRKLYLLDMFLFLIAFKGAWDSARAVSMMGLFLSPGVALQLTGFMERTAEWFSPTVPKRPGARGPDGKKGRGKGGERAREAAPGNPPKPKLPAGRVAIVGAAVLGMVAFGGTTLAFSFSQLEYGVGMTEHKFSFGAAKFLRENPVPGRMFNFFDIGGFLDWQLYPTALTFLDGRTYSQQIFLEHQQVTSAMPGWETILGKHGVTYAVLKAMDSSGMILPVVPVLANDPNWSLVFSDGLFLVFVRNLPETAEYVRRHQLPKSQIPRHIIQEAYHYMFLGVSPLVAYQTMSNMFLALGDREGAIRLLREVLKHEDEPFLRARLMELEGRGPGKPPSGR